MAAERERQPRFGQWTTEEQDLGSPYPPGSKSGYEQYFDAVSAFGPHPAMTHCEDGDELTTEEVALALPPLFPW